MEMNKKSAYDIEIDVKDLVMNGMLNDHFYLEDLKQRHLMLDVEIDQPTVSDIVAHIIRYNKEDIGVEIENRKPIIIYVSSPGGEVDAGFELIDVIQSSKTPIYTVNLGYQYSMSFLIGLAGHKRYAMKNSTFLMHDGSGIIYDSSSKMQDRADFMKRVEKMIKDYVMSRTNITSKEYSAKQRAEWYMFADEAKKKGVTDFIIGVDCELDDII